MVQLNGSYETVSQENYSEYLKSFGVADDVIQKLVNTKRTLKFNDATNDKIVITFNQTPHEFVFGKEVAYALPTGHNVKSVITRNGDKLTQKTTSVDKPGEFENKVYEFTDTGLTTTATNSSGVKAVIKFKRL